MEITTAEERVFLLHDQFTPEQIRERAWDQKMNVFGSLSKFVFRPRGEDVQVGHSEKRYEPFWYIAYRTKYVYSHKQKFQVPVQDPTIKSVTLEGKEYPVDEHRHISLDGIVHCEETAEQELFFDALNGEKRLWKQYLSFSSEEIADLTTFAPEHALVVPPEIRASYVVRQALTGAIKAFQADEVHEDTLEITQLDLYLRPLYAFEYTWQSRGKTMVAEFDGITGEIHTNARPLYQEIGKMLNQEMLFDIGSEAANLIVPGGAIAIKVARAIATSRHDTSGRVEG